MCVWGGGGGEAKRHEQCCLFKLFLINRRDTTLAVILLFIFSPKVSFFRINLVYNLGTISMQRFLNTAFTRVN